MLFKEVLESVLTSEWMATVLLGDDIWRIPPTDYLKLTTVEARDLTIIIRSYLYGLINNKICWGLDLTDSINLAEFSEFVKYVFVRHLNLIVYQFKKTMDIDEINKINIIKNKTRVIQAPISNDENYVAGSDSWRDVDFYLMRDYTNYLNWAGLNALRNDFFNEFLYKIYES